MLLLLGLANPVPCRTQTTNTQSQDAIGGGLFIAGSFLYVAAWGYGLQVLDISTPTQPKWSGGWNQRGAPTGVYVIETYAYVANRPCGLEIFGCSRPTKSHQFVKPPHWWRRNGRSCEGPVRIHG